MLARFDPKTAFKVFAVCGIVTSMPTENFESGYDWPIELHKQSTHYNHCKKITTRRYYGNNMVCIGYGNVNSCIRQLIWVESKWMLYRRHSTCCQNWSPNATVSKHSFHRFWGTQSRTANRQGSGQLLLFEPIILRNVQLRCNDSGWERKETNLAMSIRHIEGFCVVHIRNLILIVPFD